MLGWAVPPVLIAIWPSPVSAFLAFMLIGFGNPLVDVNFATLVQRVAPSAVLARVFGALESVLIGAMGLGALLFPLLLALVGLRWALVIIGVPVTLAVVLSLPPVAPVGPDRCRRRRIWTWSRRWRCSSRCRRRCRRTWPAS